VTRSDDVVLVYMTAPSHEVAGNIVRQLIDENVIACGNVIPNVTSIYRWRGETHSETEALVLIKTTSSELDRLLQRAPELHPYEVPELIAVPVVAGHAPYLQWVRDCTAGVT
jgi:periplasmic divalent cation tolerance protein